MRYTMLFILAAASSLWLAALIPAWAEEDEKAGGAQVGAATCISGTKWTAGDEGSPEMHPGMSCISCHASGEGPKFVAAGTVFRELGENSDCYGVEGVVIRLTDAKGKVIRLTTNRAGNFTLRTRGNTVAFPFTAAVLFEGRESGMAMPQSAGDCARCHTRKGANGAPGRIIVP